MSVATLGFCSVEKKHTIQHKSRICDEEGLVMIDRISVTILSLIPLPIAPEVQLTNPAIQKAVDRGQKS